MFDLRPYQLAASKAVDTALCEGQSGVCLIIPTGGGKTIIMADMIFRWLTQWPDTRIAVLAHTRELVEQNAVKFATYWHARNGTSAPMGIYCAGLKRRDIDASVIFASIQSVYSKALHLGPLEVILVDEAHHIPTIKNEGIWRQFIHDARRVNTDLRVIGLSATPWRLGSGSIIGKDAILQHIAYEIGIADLIQQGYLSPLICKGSLHQPDTSTLHIRQGEYIESEIANLMDQKPLIDAAVAEMAKLADDRSSWLVFCAGVKHSQHVADALIAAGIAAASLTGEVNAKERARIINEFKCGKLRALCNCMVLTEGFDHPGIDLVALLRPTKSAGLYYQMVGRGFRLSPEKENCLVLDFAGVIAEHGPIDTIRGKPQRKLKDTGHHSAPVKICPECQLYVHPSVPLCPACGYRWPEKPKHEAQAKKAAVLSTAFSSTPTRYPVHRVSYAKHVGQSGVPTLRVDYYFGLQRIASEWVCLEHTGYARRKAEAWWRARADHQAPACVDEALQNLPSRQPLAVHVKDQGRWPEVVSVEGL
jgi:DNA repair protein RadD